MRHLAAASNSETFTSLFGQFAMEGIVTNGSDASPGPLSDAVVRPPTPPPPPPEDSAAPPPPPDAVAPPPPDDIPPPPPVETKKKKQGWGAKKPAATPLSVEELIRKKKEADAATAKVCSCYLTSKLIFPKTRREMLMLSFTSLNSCQKLNERSSL